MELPPPATWGTQELGDTHGRACCLWGTGGVAGSVTNRKPEGVSAALLTTVLVQRKKQV